MAELSEYELQRQKNLEENRRILNSIRLEQAYSLEILRPANRKKKLRDNNDKAAERPRKKHRRDDGGDEENDSGGGESGRSLRKSARLQKKGPKKSWKGAVDGNENSDDEDFNADGEDYSDDDEDDGEYVGKKKSSRPKPSGPRVRIVIPKNRPQFYGAVPGVEVGRIWETRMACCADGIHRPTVAGIHAGPEGAYSLSLSGGYEDDVDLGDCFTYTGEGGRELKGTKSKPKNLRTAPQSKDQSLTRGNLALSLNITSRRPVRVIRGHKLDNEFAPEYGYRYDGLYSVEKYWQCVGKAGFKVFKFAIRRLPDQAPPPWVEQPDQPSTSASAGAASSADEDALDNDDEDDDQVEKPQVLTVKLFNKK